MLAGEFFGGDMTVDRPKGFRQNDSTVGHLLSKSRATTNRHESHE